MASQKRITVEIVRTTEKAHLISAEGKQGWIQKRWLDASSTVSASTFAKAVNSAEERKAEFAAKQQAGRAEREFCNKDHAVRVVKETEKAVAAEVTLMVPGGFEETKLVWFPKSAIGGADGIAMIPGWMIRERENSAAENYSPSGRSYYPVNTPFQRLNTWKSSRFPHALQGSMESLPYGRVTTT